ncbi:DAK2 domain-containing protein [Actinopolymorpha alba]|uniref:DAK2 domain-containing protein n=1 Tax=Actinopolymorpha alba TaxID=533267 RepID=UPI000369F434|nr:DAK2 domain-containing protein [Actinopolymorpha alba]
MAGVPVLARCCRAAFAALVVAREEIDALNVYPVPDADTGTNLVRTMDAACRALDGQVEDRLGGPADVGTHLHRVARAAMIGACGNSGIILAQFLHGAARALDGRRVLDGPALARALAAASAAGYDAVERPVEGTILTVARAAAEAATRRAAESGPTPAAVLSAATGAAEAALADTTQQLDPLRRAGVVDAGGCGFVVVLEAFAAVLVGQPTRSTGQPARPTALAGPTAPRAVAKAVTPTVARPRAAPSPASYAAPTGLAYEVTYLVDAADAAIAGLRASLSSLGECLVVSGGEGLWHIHVHVDDATAAVDAGASAGRPRQIRITRLDGGQAGGDCAPGLPRSASYAGRTRRVAR